jgi:hypothetical protein
MIYFDIIFFIFSPDQGTTGEMVDFYVVQTPSDGHSINNVFLKRNVCHILHKPKIRGIMVRKDSKNCDS